MPGVYLDRWPALWGTGKPNLEHQLEIERSGPLAVGLSLLCLFDNVADGYVDFANDARTFTHHGTVHTEDGAFGGQAWTAQTASSGEGFSPYASLSPPVAQADSYTISALIHFDGTDPQSGGAYNSQGRALCSDGNGRFPIMAWGGLAPDYTGFQVSQSGSSGSFYVDGASQPYPPRNLTGWHRLSAVCNSTAGTTTLYIDGGYTWVGVTQFVQTAFALSTMLGGGPSTQPGTDWPWPTADLFFWRRALTAAEVAGHAISPWRSTLRPRFRAGWQAIPVTSPTPPPPPPPPITGGPTLAGLGRFAAEAFVEGPTATATFHGTGFAQASEIVRLLGRATLAGTGGIFADPLSTAVTADIHGVGGLAATARVKGSVTATIPGTGSVAPGCVERALALTATFGVGGLTANATWIENPHSAHATIGGTSGFSATVTVGRGPTANLAGAGSFVPVPSSSLTGKWADQASPGAEGGITANAVVVRKPKVMPGIAPTALPGFYAVEIETYVPGFAAVNATEGHGTRAHGTLSQRTQGSPELTQIIRASDMGYRSAPSDANGPAAYPPVLDQAFQISAMINLEPDKSPASAAWGSMLLVNLHNQWLDKIAGSQNCDGRPIKVWHGTKRWDAARQYMADPAYGSLTPAFFGLGTAWTLTETELQIPLRDATYYLETALTINVYGGTGRLDGTAALATKPLPFSRGGTATSPINNVSPVLVDPVSLIYQYNDGPGTVVNLYEGGKAVFTYAGNVGDLYSGTSAPGTYRTDNARGLFQLGSSPVAAITADVTGAFRIAGPQWNPFWIAYLLLSEVIAVPSSMIDANSFWAIAQAHDYVGGLYFAGLSATPTGLQVIEAILQGMGAAVVPSRNGTLRLMLLREISLSDLSKETLDEGLIISVTPRSLPTSLYPPRYRLQIGYQHNYTIQTSGLNATTPLARQQYLAASDQYAGWSSTAILRAYRRPNDPGEISTGLLRQSDAQIVANDLGILWGKRMRLYDVVVPIQKFDREIGDVVQLRYPIEDLDDGKLGRVVGYSLRSVDTAVTYSILV